MRIRFSKTGFEELKEKFKKLQSERPAALAFNKLQYEADLRYTIILVCRHWIF